MEEKIENKEKLPSRKHNRLAEFHYGAGYSYFITICTKDRSQILSDISVGTGVLDCPQIKLTYFGEIADKYINQLNYFYDNIFVDQYVIMPNHIHLILTVRCENGQSGTPVPTRGNSTVSSFVSTFKRFSNKEYGFNPWQRSFYDHVIRNRQDYDEIRKYIFENPQNWENDEMFSIND
jgi:REP element-mobilizing transposase RayT